MEHLNVCNNFYEIISGTSSVYSKPYLEAKQIAEDNDKSLSQIKNFIISIENLADKKSVKDERISSSKGKISEFKGYNDINNALDFLKKNLGNVSAVTDLNSIKSSLEKYQRLYSDGYSKNIRLVMLEYESAVYSLVTGLSYLIANGIEISATGYNLKISKKRENDAGVITKINSDLAKQLSDKKHEGYLFTLIEGKKYVGVNTNIEECTFVESAVSDTLDLFDAITTNISKILALGKRGLIGIKNSVFGILPLIRSIIYLRYKKKADTIVSLEQQMDFIEKNIQQLQNMKNMDPEKKATIIKKQQATVEAYRKKAEKLRAQLIETEKETASEINKNNTTIKSGEVKVNTSSNTSSDDDLVLEGTDQSFQEASNNQYNSMDDDYLRSNYIPSIYQKDIYSINYDALKNKGIKLISYDIDETIAGDDDKYPPKSAVTLFENLKNDDFTVVLITNTNEERAQLFSKLLGVDKIARAVKPLGSSFIQILKGNGLSKNEMIHVGNSILDDVAGGNSAGIYTALVDFCKSEKDMKPEEKTLIETLKDKKLFSKGKYFSFVENLNESGKMEEKRFSSTLKIKKKNMFKKDLPVNGNKTELPEFDKDLFEKVLKEFHEKTGQKTVTFTLSDKHTNDDPSKLTSSKLGGKAYWTKDKKYPQFNGKDMVMIAQINFAEIPNIPNFPTKGILQFFVKDSECECDYNFASKCIYHDSVSNNNDDIDTSVHPLFGNDDTEYPVFDGVYYLSGKVEEMYPVDVFGKDLNDSFMPIFNKHFDTDVKSFLKIEDNFKDKYMVWQYIYQKITKDVPSWGTRLGGYPNFTQSDPRNNKLSDQKKYDKLLLQIDSKNGIMWGDCGIANFFISEEHLKNANFDDVFFTWDCC